MLINQVKHNTFRHTRVGIRTRTKLMYIGVRCEQLTAVLEHLLPPRIPANGVRKIKGGTTFILNR